MVNSTPAFCSSPCLRWGWGEGYTFWDREKVDRILLPLSWIFRRGGKGKVVTRQEGSFFLLLFLFRFVCVRKKRKKGKREVRRPNVLNFFLVLLINTWYVKTFATSSELCLFFLPSRDQVFSPFSSEKSPISDTKRRGGGRRRKETRSDLYIKPILNPNPLPLFFADLLRKKTFSFISPKQKLDSFCPIPFNVCGKPRCREKTKEIQWESERCLLSEFFKSGPAQFFLLTQYREENAQLYCSYRIQNIKGNMNFRGKTDSANRFCAHLNFLYTRTSKRRWIIATFALFSLFFALLKWEKGGRISFFVYPVLTASYSVGLVSK